jgi:hypothetical protein
MRGSLGEKIGEGAYADVHAWAPGQVLKLFKAGFPRRHTWWEARMARAAYATGAPAPEVFGEVTLEGRFGIVPQRLDGPTLLQLSRSGAMTPEQTGATLATLYISVHKTASPPDVPSLRDSMDGQLRFSGGMLPEHIATGILTLIERLAPGDGLCHGDLHAGNVIMTAGGPRLIDWGVRPALPPASTSRAVTFSFASSPRKASPIRSGRAQSMRPCSTSTRGWPVCRPRRSRRRWSHICPSYTSAPCLGRREASPCGSG